MTPASSQRKTETAAGSNVVIDIVIESPKWQALPEASDIVRRAITVAAAVRAASAGAAQPNYRREIAVLLSDDAAIGELNERWRGHAGPTNVLSFPAATSAVRGLKTVPLGDIAIAYDTVAREAAAHGKPLAHHLAHLAIHGFLHLLGYDHQKDEEAEDMERLERETLARIGIADPYAADGIGLR